MASARSSSPEPCSAMTRARVSPVAARRALCCRQTIPGLGGSHGQGAVRSLRRSGRRSPKTYARDDIPKLDRYPDGQTLPTPKAIDFKPGELLGSVSGELGLRKFLEGAGHTLVVTSDKDGPNSVARARAARRRDRHLAALLAGLSDRRAHRQGAEAASSPSPPASAPIMSTCRRRWSAASRSPRSPTATRSASPSTW